MSAESQGASGWIPLATLDRDQALTESAARVHSRGELLRGRVGWIALGSLALPGAARAADRNADHDILNYALALEYLQAAFYTEAERFGALSGRLAEQARVVGSHERAHVSALRSLLGGRAIKPPQFDFQGVTENPAQFRQTAVAFEDLGAAAYKAEAPKIRTPQYLAAAVRIHSVEARHAAWIRRVAGAVPAPDAFDEPKPRPEVERLVASTKFVVADPVTGSRSEPRFTG
jgi:hypothetical protein